MSNSLLATFGVLSAVVNLIAFIPYLRDILARKTKPERATWWIWLTLNVITLFAERSGGAKWSLLQALSAIITQAVIAILSLWYGYGKFHRRDVAALLIAAAGVGLWLITNDPLLAVIIIVFVDLTGIVLTLAKTWVAPHTETLSAWLISTISIAFGLLAVGNWKPVIYLYALYSVIVNLAIIGVILYRRPRLAFEPADF